MYRPPWSSVAPVAPIVLVAAVLHYHSPAFIPAALLVALGIKQSFFPPLLRPLSQPEATTRLKFNVFVLLHLAISVAVFPPYLSLRRAIVWYIDEYVQGRRGGQKSWATSGFKSAEGTIALIAIWNVIEAIVAIRYPTAVAPSEKGRLNLSSTKVSSPITRAYHSGTETPAKDPNAVRYRSSPSPSPLASTPKRLFNNSQTQNQGSPLKQQSSSLVSSQLGVPITTGNDDFVMVDRSEREWVDNIRKSVRGKGGTLGR